MTRRIFFRGQTLDSGKFVFGYYISRRDAVTGKIKDYIFDGKSSHRVVNVVQFVGNDKDGNDVYEGDTLLDEYGNQHVAMIQDFPKVIASLMLKA